MLLCLHSPSPSAPGPGMLNIAAREIFGWHYCSLLVFWQYLLGITCLSLSISPTGCNKNATHKDVSLKAACFRYWGGKSLHHPLQANFGASSEDPKAEHQGDNVGQDRSCPGPPALPCSFHGIRSSAMPPSGWQQPCSVQKS